MRWPPQIGDPLPRAADAWRIHSKLINWVLGEKGHADEWRRIFRVGTEDEGLVWESIAKAVVEAQITELRGEGDTVTYGVLIELKINNRAAPVLTAWHYEDANSSPRLVTAYPKPYTRRNGNYG